MGSFPSTSRDRISSAERGEIQYAPYAPDEASTKPEDDTSLWPDFWEKVSLYPHKDGNSIIVWENLNDDLGPNPRCRPGWPIKRLRKAYEALGEDHPRIVRYLGPLHNPRGHGVIVERLTPGPHWSAVPVMTIPVLHSDLQSREDKIILSLHYRWALQALSAIGFFHSRSVYIKYFASTNVWLHPDFSLALTGFISASGPELEADSRKDAIAEAKKQAKQEREYQAWAAGTPVEDVVEVAASDRKGEDDDGDDEECFCKSWDECEWAGNGNVFWNDLQTGPPDEWNLKEDLFYWAIFVWELMTNDHTTECHWARGIHDWSPFSPVEGSSQPAKTRAEKLSAGHKDWHDDLQVLEEERLGSVLLKAWKGEYERAEDAAEDVKKIAENVGIKVVGDDEVDIGEKWEDVFEMVKDEEWKWGPRLVFRGKEKTEEKEHELEK